MKEKSKTGAGPRKKIVWSEIHSRLERAETAREKGRTPAEKTRILQERARTLARVSRADEGAAGRLEILEFLLAHEKYAVETSHVREVYPLKELTPIPGTPPFVLGIINVRSQILSILDVKKLFDLPEKGVTDLNKVIILKSDAMEFGIAADVILGVRTIPLAEVQPPLPMLTGIRGDYVKGVTKERLVVLDAGKILSAGELIVQDEN